MNLLYVGPVKEGTTSAMRLRALQELGHSVQSVAIDGPVEGYHLTRTWDRVLGKLFRLGFGRVSLPDRRGVNTAILRAAEERPWKVLWLDKALTVTPNTLRRFRQLCPRAVVAGYSPDDMAARHSQSRQFLESLPFYDVYFTTKSFNVSELRTLGCPRVKFVKKAYDRHVHRAIEVTEAERALLGAPVGFIGSAELDRAKSCAFLAGHGIPVKVWGDGWDTFQRRTGGEFIVGGPSRYGDDYVKTICSFDISLCFLRKMNRDLQTARSIEIPACGAFMLAERTTEHLELFEESKEAEFFASDDELLAKVRFYLDHAEERKRIAAAGRQRCLSGHYSYHDRLKDMLAYLDNLHLGGSNDD